MDPRRNDLPPALRIVLAAQDALKWPLASRYLLSISMHAVNVALVSVLALRASGHAAGLVAFGLAALWSSDAEVSLWLGARCDVLVALFGVLGAHASLSAARAESGAVVWSLLAACAALLASLAKETGWLLPVIWAPLMWCKGQFHWRLLIPSTLAVVFTLVVRLWTLPSLLGPYIEHYAEPDPTRAVRMVVRVLGQIGLGDAAPDWHSLLLLGAAVTCALLWLLWRLSPASWPRRIVTACALVAVVGPASVKVAPRTLYPVVLVLACSLGWAWPSLRKRPLAVLALGTFALWQAGSSLVVVHQWASAHRERSAAVHVLRKRLREDENLLVMGTRNRFRRRLLGFPVSYDLGGDAPLGHVCIPYPNEHYDFAQSCEPEAALLVEGALTPLGDCSWRFELADYGCDGRLHQSQQGPVHVELIDGKRAVKVTVKRGQDVVALWRDEHGRTQRSRLRCEVE